MKKNISLLTFVLLQFAVVAHAGLLQDIFGTNKPKPLDTNSCPKSFSVEIDNIKSIGFDQDDISLTSAVQILSKIESQSIHYFLSKTDKKQGLCHYKSISKNLGGVLYVMGTKKFPQTAFAANLDLNDILNINILVQSHSQDSLSVKSNQTVSVWADSDGEFPVQIGIARVNN